MSTLRLSSLNTTSTSIKITKHKR